MSDELQKLEDHCGPEYNENCILAYFHANRDLPWLGYARGLTNIGWLDNDWSCYQRADVILHQLTAERADQELKARICLSGCINATSIQLKWPDEVQYLNGRNLKFWLRWMVQICDYVLPDEQLFELEQRLGIEPVESAAVDEVYDLVNQIWAEFQMKEHHD